MNASVFARCVGHGTRSFRYGFQPSPDIVRLPPQRAQVPQREVSSGKQGAWLLSESHTLERLTDVLEERAAELAELGLNNDAYLPFAQQKKVQDRLRQRWLESLDGRLEPP